MHNYKPHIAILVKMGNDQLLRREDLASFESTLQEHQLAVRLHCVFYFIEVSSGIDGS
jgi:hypothetical protein